MDDDKAPAGVVHLTTREARKTRYVFLSHIITATNYVGFLGQTVIVARRQGLLG